MELYIEKKWEEGVVGAPEGRRELWVHQRGGGSCGCTGGEEGVVGAPEGRRELWVHQRGGGAGMKMVLVHDTLIINR